MKEIVEYRVHYLKHSNLGGKDGFIIKDKSCKSEQEVKDFIKSLDPKDVVKSVGKRTYQRLDLKNFV